MFGWKVDDISGNYYLSVANADCWCVKQVINVNKVVQETEYLLKHPFQVYPTENINSDEWQMITFVKNNDEITLLVNASIKEVEQDASISNITIEAEWVVLGTRSR